MMRFGVIALALLPQTALAQQWTASLSVKGAETASYDDSGNALFIGTSNEGAWNGTELYQSVPLDDDVDCDAAREYEIDHYVGYGSTYTLQVLITFIRDGNGTWAAIDPDIYYDTDRDNYAGFDGTAKLQSLTCDNDKVTASFSFRGEAVAETGKGKTVQINGRSTVTLPVYPYSDY